MRARGFAIRDAFPDVLKGLITVEEAQDFPSETRTAQPLPNAPVKNPLDSIGHSKSEVLPVQIPDDLVKVNVALQEASVVDEDGVIETEVLAQEPIAADQLDHLGWELAVPGKESKFFADYVVWAEAYEDIAEKVFKYEKMLPRTRMTKLRDLREANLPIMDKIDAAQRILHTATYSKRLATLGAQLTTETVSSEGAQA